MSSIYRKSDFFVVQPFGTYLLLNSSSIIKNLIKAGEDVRWNEQIFYSATYFDADQINCFARLINFDVSEIVVHQLNTDHRVTKTEMRMEIEIKSKEDSLLFIGLRTKFNIDNSLISTRIHCGNQVGEFAHFLKRIMKKTLPISMKIECSCELGVVKTDIQQLSNCNADVPSHKIIQEILTLQRE